MRRFGDLSDLQDEEVDLRSRRELAKLDRAGIERWEENGTNSSGDKEEDRGSDAGTELLENDLTVSRELDKRESIRDRCIIGSDRRASESDSR